MKHENRLIQRWSDPQFIEEAKPIIYAFTAQRHLPANTDFRGIIIGLDGAWPEMLHQGFVEMDLVELDASHARCSCTFFKSKLTKCTFEEAMFDTCRFQNAQLTGCNFSRAKFDSPVLDDAHLTQCQFENTEIKGRGYCEYGGRRVTFTNCTFKDAILENLQFRATTFRNCIFEGVQLRKCFLAGVEFEGKMPATDAFQKCKMQSVQMNGQPIT